MSRAPRKVAYATKMNILKEHAAPLFIGFIFILISITIFFIFSINEGNTPKVDYDLINQEGTETVAKITDIETQYNTKVNGVHPTIISYQYEDNGRTINFKFKTLAERKAQRLEIGAEIPIKKLNGQSIIKDLKPFDATILKYVLLLLFLIGLPFLLYAVYQSQKKLKLYKYGTISNGKILSIVPRRRSKKSQYSQGAIVHYQYKTTKGQSLIGKSFTDNLLIINNKKEAATLPIFVSKDQEEKSCIIPELEAIRNNWEVDF